VTAADDSGGAIGHDPIAREHIATLEERLREATETLDAIRSGEVDALVVDGPGGQVVYALENADRPYRVLVESMKEGAVTLTGNGMILYCNEHFAELVERRAQQIVGASLFDFVRQRAELERMLAAGGGGESAEMLLIAADGADIPVNVSVVELEIEDGAGRVLCGIITDLSHNYARAREIAEANARLAAEIVERAKAEESLAIALDAADMGSWDLILATGEMHRSPSHDAIFGRKLPAETWTLQTTIDHFTPEDRDAVRAAFDAAAVRGRVEFERRIVREGDGALRWVFVKGRTFYGNHGAERVAGVVTDVTDRRLIDEQLRQAQKMEAIGQLTGGIAHDFNNLLMIIGGSLEALSRGSRFDDRTLKFLAAARSGVARGAKLNQQLLAFARRQDMQVEVVSVNELLPTFETLLDRAMGETVVVRVEPGIGVWRCKTDPNQLETAILNLAINARDAMSGGGTLTLTTANVAVTQAVATRWETHPGDYVEICLTDTGSGMDADQIARAFEPFFTTKDIGRGTGLGLSQVYGFAKQSGGFVAIESSPGRGASVSIYLPRSDAPLPAPRAIVTAPAQAPAAGVVLLVEDDAEVRAASAAMLEALGYTVRQAGGGQEALTSLEANADVALVFSDVIMASGMSGIELRRRIKAEYPNLPVLLTSGYTAHLIPDIDGGLPVLHKPYTLDALGEAIRNALRSRTDLEASTAPTS